MINGVTQLLMMKVDVLNVFSTIKICTQYRLTNGTTSDILPYEYVTEQVTPIYTELKGWNCSLEGISDGSMPMELNAYVEFLEQELQVPITLISSGPDRTQTMHRQKITV
jgi:adenylosuccinate synthase